VIDRTEAANRARAAVGDECVLLQDQTLEEPFGWVFFYESKAYVETGELSHALAGNAPIVVLRDSGDVRVTGTAHAIDHYLTPLREEWRQRQD
jgi:hypothetical protein